MGKTVRTEATPAILKVLLPDDPPTVPNRQITELLSLSSLYLPIKGSRFRLLLFPYHLTSDSFDTK